jgi:hypothetical protein
MVATVILIITGKMKLTEDGEKIEDIKVILEFILLSPIVMITLIIDRLMGVE